MTGIPGKGGRPGRSGRKSLPEGERREQYGVRLPPALVERARRAGTAAVEAALDAGLP